MLAAFRALAFLFLLYSANAAPIVHRQDSGNGTTTLMTQQTTDTAVGQMTQTCVITLTPITDDNGNPAVREVKTCSVTMNGASSNNGSSGSSNSTTTNGSSNGSSNGSNTSSSTTTASGTDVVGTGGNGAVTANGVSTVAAPPGGAVSVSSQTTQAAAASGSPGAAVVAGSVSTVNVPPSFGTAVAAAGGSSSSANAGSNNGAVPAATAAQENASASSSAFAVPGQKIQVLPIGLGVFAGISVIALIVVGLVTYERTKYRKAFRARKLAEQGGQMGYGGQGMAQR